MMKRASDRGLHHRQQYCRRHAAVRSSLYAFFNLLTIFVDVTAAAAMTTTTTSTSTQQRLSGQRILVTGGGRGIGRAIALLCHRQGAQVAITSRTRAELEETASLATLSDDTCSRPVAMMEIYTADVTKQEEVETFVSDLTHKWGGIDVLVNNAGASQPTKGPSETLDSDDLSRLLDINLVAVHRVTSAVLRHCMLPAGAGRIVNISSRAGKVGLPNVSFYVASKFALEGLTASLAEELKDRNVQVNTLSPGMVDTTSFPKAPGRPGVRSAESVEDGFFAVLESDVTGHYLHVDELDEARAKGLADNVALKPIREPLFKP